jgi:chromosome segregation ATPase
MAEDDKNKKLKEILEKQKHKQSYSSGGPVDINQQEMLNEFYSLNARFDKVVTEISQLKGKIEMEEESRSAIGDRISDITSQIGELRSIVVSREKFFDKMEADFLKIKEDVSAINPQDIQNQFEKLEGRFVKDEVKIDKNDNRLMNIDETLRNYQEMMGKIKGFDNLFDMLQNLDKKINYIEQVNSKSERMNAKIESIFSEINDKASSIGTHEDRLNSMEKNLSQVGSRVDKVMGDFKKTATKDDIKSLSQKFNVMKERLYKKEVVSFINQNISVAQDQIKKSQQDIAPQKETSEMTSVSQKKMPDESLDVAMPDVSLQDDSTIKGSSDLDQQKKETIKAKDFSKALHTLEDKEMKKHAAEPVEKIAQKEGLPPLNPKLENLLGYVRKNLNDGLSQEELKDMIIEVGWSEKDFDECMKYV